MVVATAAVGVATTAGVAIRTMGGGGGLSGRRPIGGGTSAPSAGGTNGARKPRITGVAAGAQAADKPPTTVVKGRDGKNGGGGCSCGTPATVGSTVGPAMVAAVTDGGGPACDDTAAGTVARVGGSGSGGSGGSSGSGGGHGSTSDAMSTGGGGLGLLVGSHGS